MNTDLAKLTTCSVRDDGKVIEIGFVDASGNPVTLRLPFDCAQSVAMTLPGLLTRAVQLIAGNDQARYVFPLGHWSVAKADDAKSVIMTMSTEDGFSVSFGIPFEACNGLGWALQHEIDEPLDDALPAPPRYARAN